MMDVSSTAGRFWSSLKILGPWASPLPGGFLPPDLDPDARLPQAVRYGTFDSPETAEIEGSAFSWGAARAAAEAGALASVGGALHSFAGVVRRFASRHPIFGVSGSHQIAAPGFSVPIKAYLNKPLLAPLQRGTDGLPVHFYALTPDNRVIAIGSSPANSRGQATAYFTPDAPGEYKIFYRLEGEARFAFHEHGTLTVSPQDKPVIALDIDHLVLAEGFGKVIDFLNAYSGPYRFVALTYSAFLRGELLAAGLRIPVVVNDYHSSPFMLKRRRFGETQLEKLKRLKFEGGLPIVGVVSREFKSKPSYFNSGIEILNFKDLMLPSEGLPFRQRAALSKNWKEFNRKLKESRDDFYWDGMTESRAVAGNRVEYFTENGKAAAEMFRLIDGAQSFIHVGNYAIHNDEFGHKVLERLKARAREGIKVRMIIDRMSQAPCPTEKGFSWLDDEMLDELAAAGVEIVYHRMFQPPDSDQDTRGLLTRRHRKVLIVDYADANVARQVVAYLGGRIIGGMSYDETRLDADWFYRTVFSIGRGSFRDFNATVYGPAVREISLRFCRDFVDYGGRVAPDDVKAVLGPVVVQGRGTKLRYVTHESYLNQNCHNILMHFLKAPDSDEVTFVNSFYPTEEIIDAMIQAVRRGRKVTVIFSLFWWMSARRNKLIPKLVKNGVEVYVAPYQLHTKLYANNRFFGFGNQNLEILSQHDSEDLTLIERTEADAAPIEAYVGKLKADAIRINDHFGPDADAKAVVSFVENIPNTLPFTHDGFTDHSLWQGLWQLAKITKSTFLEGLKHNLWYVGLRRYVVG